MYSVDTGCSLTFGVRLSLQKSLLGFAPRYPKVSKGGNYVHICIHPDLRFIDFLDGRPDASLSRQRVSLAILVFIYPS